MKDLLRSSLISLITGILFAIGVIAGIFLFELIPSNSSSAGTEERKGLVELPADFQIKEHAQVSGLEKFTVRGKLFNAGTSTWYAPTIQATIKAGRATMNSCSTIVDAWFNPNDELWFTLSCDGVTGTDLPDNVTYELVVLSAWG